MTIDELAIAAKRERAEHDARIERLRGLGRAARIGLVGCAKAKRDVAAPARELYRSPLFALSLAHAERSCDETFVVSGAHGLLALDEVVRPYDRSLRELPKKERTAWGSRIAGALAARFGALPLELLILAGLEYAGPIRSGALGHGWTIDTPLARKPIGERLAWLKERLAVPTPEPQKRRRGKA